MKKYSFHILLLILFSFPGFAQESFFPQQIPEIIQKADLGNTDAQYTLAEYYLQGKEIDKSPQKAIYWLRKAADKGHTDAQWRLGQCYLHGEGVKKKLSQAKKLLEKAAQNGNLKAQYELGILYQGNNDVYPNNHKSFYWLLKASSQGFYEALKELNKTGYNLYDDFLTYTLKNIAEGYFTQVLINTDSIQQKEFLEEYRKVIRIAAEKGDAEAQCKLAVHYIKGNYGYPVNYEEAMEWLTKTKVHVPQETHYYLGILQYEGKGTEQNYREAYNNFRKAANENYAPSYRYLADCYEQGHGTIKEVDKAFQYYLKAITETNCTYSMAKVGYHYLYGIGTAINYQLSKEYFQKAAQEEEPAAYNGLGLLCFHGLKTEVNYSKAIEWFIMAAYNPEKRYLPAFESLGICYLLGKGVPQNYEQAVGCFKKARNESWQANFLLGICNKLGIGTNVNDERAEVYFEKVQKKLLPSYMEIEIEITDKNIQKSSDSQTSYDLYNQHINYILYDKNKEKQIQATIVALTRENEPKLQLTLIPVPEREYNILMPFHPDITLMPFEPKSSNETSLADINELPKENYPAQPLEDNHPSINQPTNIETIGRSSFRIRYRVTTTKHAPLKELRKRNN